MVSSVLSRPSHYEVLGLDPAAGDGDVARAFAKKMSLFGTHAPGEAARICAAYETLRDPHKRRDYDRSIGLGAKPQPTQWAFAVKQAQWPGFPAAAPGRGAEPRREVSPEVERASAIAASLRKLPEPEARPAQWPLPNPDPVPEADVYRILDQRARPTNFRDDETAIEWRRPAVIVGGLIVAAGMIGAFAGLSVKGDAESATTAPAVTVPLPAATEVAEAPPAPPASAPVPVELAAQSPAPAKHVAARSRFAKAVETQVAVPESADETQRVDATTSTPVTTDAAPQPVAASMPLPDKVVARTIERIGYSCGSVTGAVAGGSPGTYDVTCSSGATYRATPIHGRYRFRRSR